MNGVRAFDKIEVVELGAITFTKGEIDGNYTIGNDGLERNTFRGQG